MSRHRTFHYVTHMGGVFRLTPGAYVKLGRLNEAKAEFDLFALGAEYLGDYQRAEDVNPTQRVRERKARPVRRTKEIRITQHWHFIGRNKVADPVVHYGQRSLRCDFSLDGRLSKLIPPRCFDAQPEDWRPFVEKAVVLGLL